MKRLFIFAGLPILITAATFATGAEESKFKTPQEELSYVLGMDMGASLKRLGTDVDLKTLMQGLEHTLKGEQTLLTSEQANNIKQAFFKKRQEEQAAEQKAAGERNLKEGEAFLAENKTREGVKTTESGLQYLIVKQGDGPKPKDTDQVKVHYRGTLIDGTEFDSSHKRGEPVTFPVKGVIPGWTEGLQLMPVGSTYKLFIPAKLAYGERGAGRQIGPNATLIFEVELLDIVKPEPGTEAEDEPADEEEKGKK